MSDNFTRTGKAYQFPPAESRIQLKAMFLPNHQGSQAEEKIKIVATRKKEPLLPLGFQEGIFQVYDEKSTGMIGDLVRRLNQIDLSDGSEAVAVYHLKKLTKEMDMKKTLIMVVVLLSVLWTAAAWAQLKDGMWEITTQVQIAGMQQQMPPTTFRQCITKSDPVAKNQDKNYDCKTTSQKISGNTVSYAVACTGKDGEMQTTGKSTYTGNTMDGSATTSFKMKGQPAMQMNSKMSGKYIGPCSK